MEKLGVSDRDPSVDEGVELVCPVCGTRYSKTCRQCPYCDWKPGMGERLEDQEKPRR